MADESERPPIEWRDAKGKSLRAPSDMGELTQYLVEGNTPTAEYVDEFVATKKGYERIVDLAGGLVRAWYNDDPEFEKWLADLRLAIAAQHNDIGIDE